MVYIPRVSFNTGICPSLIHTFPRDGKFTGTQRLLLTSSRIFGWKIGGNQPSGMRPFRELRVGRNFLFPYRIDIHEFHRYVPAMAATKAEAFFRNVRLVKVAEKAKKEARKGKKGK